MQAAWATVREERDPAFWQAVADHPQVRHALHGHSVDMGAIVGAPGVIPLASAHGGLIFTQRDPFGTVWELHTLYTPEGWRREVHDAAIAAFAQMFGERNAALIFTYETDHPQSKAPKSFGFANAGLTIETVLGTTRTVFLTADAWHRSPAWRRACQ